MRLTHFFIDRPRFATVLSVFVTSLGLGALAILPVANYQECVRPTVKVTTSYPGASAETVARTVATPLEQEINGVENMLYMNSQSTGDGNLTITVTFAIGTDLNIAQMLTQNRVQDVLKPLIKAAGILRGHWHLFLLPHAGKVATMKRFWSLAFSYGDTLRRITSMPPLSTLTNPICRRRCRLR